MSLYVQGLPTEHYMCWYFAALDVKISIHLDVAPLCKQRKHVQPRDLQHFGYQSSSSTHIRPDFPFEVAMERCLAEYSQPGDQSPDPAVVAAGCWSGPSRR